ncbi:hypothetical protein GTW71_22820 [Streptomyces sp. SID6041]|nr:hypothetical protein [Streptomyces sp. SID6041]
MHPNQPTQSGAPTDPLDPTDPRVPTEPADSPGTTNDPLDTTGPRRTTGEHVPDARRRRAILVAVCVALMAVIASVSGLNVAQPDLAVAFGASQKTAYRRRSPAPCARVSRLPSRRPAVPVPTDRRCSARPGSPSSTAGSRPCGRASP